MTTTTFRPSTARQQAFLDKLLGEKSVEAETLEAIALQRVEGMSTRQASGWIDYLLAQPRKSAPVADENSPAPGYYAVEHGGALRFYRVVEGKGKWEGRTFLNRFRSDELDRVFTPERRAVYAAILEAPEAAAQRFAEETVCCYTCGRRLTDETSRERGQGSDCYSRTH